MFDVETMDAESTAVILSAAIIKFDFNEVLTFEDYVKRACFVKFDAKSQIKDYKRTVSKDTMAWWEKQSEIAKRISLIPSADDVSAKEGIDTIKKYVEKHGGKDTFFWARGSLDQMVIDSLCTRLQVPYITQYNRWRDVRTAIDIIANDSKEGYCKIKNFDYNKVLKHDPVQDCALDIMMMVNHE